MSNQTSNTSAGIILDNHLRTEIFLPSIIMMTVSIFGQFGNASIVWATLRNKHLQSRCNWLIAMNAAVDVIHQFSHYIFAYFIFTGINYTTAKTCFFLQQLSFIAFVVGMIFIVLVGVDRTFSVLLPTRYKTLNPILYMSVMVSFPLTYTVLYWAFSYKEMLTFADQMVICNIGSGNGPIISNIGIYFNYVIEGLMVVVYGIMFLSFVLRKNQNSASRKVIKSLSVILIIILICWPGMFIYRPLILSLFPSLFGDNLELQMEYLGIFINIGVASNYYVYYMFSRDYRAAFQRQLSFIPYCRKVKKQQVQTVHQQTQAVSGIRSILKINNLTTSKNHSTVSVKHVSF